MSKHLGNVVDPDELVARYGADTVRLAVLYAARPQRSLNWSDSAVLRCHRFLDAGVGVHASQARRGSRRSPASGGRGRRCSGGEEPSQGHERAPAGCDCPSGAQTGVERTTEDMEQLEMHTAVRNVMRLFERIKDFEKRVIARQGELGRADRDALIEALTLLAQLLAHWLPTSPRSCGSRSAQDEHSAQTPWPGVSFRVPA